MKDIILSVVESLDGETPELFPYLHYILQDFVEIGADPVVMVQLLKKHLHPKFLRIADLGCGKGAISVALAKEFDCLITGIDAMPEFVKSAKNYADKIGVPEKCNFYTGDIRIEILSLKGFDIAILGAIGNVFGNVGETLTKVRKILNTNGYVLLDDGWSKQVENRENDIFPTSAEYFSMIAGAGFKVVEMVIADMNDYYNVETFMMDSMRNRCNELSELYPQHNALFNRYIQNQQREFARINNELTCATLLLQSEV